MIENHLHRGVVSQLVVEIFSAKVTDENKNSKIRTNYLFKQWKLLPTIVEKIVQEGGYRVVSESYADFVQLLWDTVGIMQGSDIMFSQESVRYATTQLMNVVTNNEKKYPMWQKKASIQLLNFLRRHAIEPSFLPSNAASQALFGFPPPDPNPNFLNQYFDDINSILEENLPRLFETLLDVESGISDFSLAYGRKVKPFGVFKHEVLSMIIELCTLTPKQDFHFASDSDEDSSDSDEEKGIKGDPRVHLSNLISKIPIRFWGPFADLIFSSPETDLVLHKAFELIDRIFLGNRIVFGYFITETKFMSRIAKFWEGKVEIHHGRNQTGVPSYRRTGLHAYIIQFGASLIEFEEDWMEMAEESRQQDGDSEEDSEMELSELRKYIEMHSPSYTENEGGRFRWPVGDPPSDGEGNQPEVDGQRLVKPELPESDPVVENKQNDMENGVLVPGYKDYLHFQIKPWLEEDKVWKNLSVTIKEQIKLQHSKDLRMRASEQIESIMNNIFQGSIVFFTQFVDEELASSSSDEELQDPSSENEEEEESD